jgi:putative phosphoribosyl transferase
MAPETTRSQPKPPEDHSMPQLPLNESVRIGIGADSVHGNLHVPAAALGMVLFAHGSGSGRKSARNNAVAGVLNQAGLGTLLMDLLTPDEEPDVSARFDIALLAQRLALAADWLAGNEATRTLALGIFGASTGAAAALQMAAARPQMVGAVVSRGGRPDLAGRVALAAVRAPTLLIVGALDTDVIALNRAAYAEIGAEKQFEIVAGASHLFEEPGRLDMVAELARNWFVRWLPGAPQPARQSVLS